MKLFVALVCTIFPSAFSVPTPQDFDEVQFIQQGFDEDNLAQQGNLSPQGFTQQTPIQLPQPETRQNSFSETKNFISANGATLSRYFFDLQDFGYKFT